MKNQYFEMTCQPDEKIHSFLKKRKLHLPTARKMVLFNLWSCCMAKVDYQSFFVFPNMPRSQKNNDNHFVNSRIHTGVFFVFFSCNDSATIECQMVNNIIRPTSQVGGGVLDPFVVKNDDDGSPLPALLPLLLGNIST